MFCGRSIVRLADSDHLGNVHTREFQKNSIVLRVILKTRRTTTAESVQIRAKNSRRSWTRKSPQQRSVHQLSAARIQKSTDSRRFQTYSECRYDINLFILFSLIPLTTSRTLTTPPPPDINVYRNTHVWLNVDRQCDLFRRRSTRRVMLTEDRVYIG